jgi:prolyl oligopeptidase
MRSESSFLGHVRRRVSLLVLMITAPLVLLLSVNLRTYAQSYPTAPKIPVVDTIFGRIITDEYRWMEDMNSPQTLDWLKAEATLTENLLNKIPGREALLADFRKFDTLNKMTISNVRRGGDHYFYKKNLAGENEGKLYFRNGRNGKEMLLFDPKTWGDGKGTTTFNYRPSHDGRQVALSLNDGTNNDVNRIKVMTVDTKAFLPEEIYPVLGGAGSWTPDDQGFLYTEASTADAHSNQLFQHMKAKFHRMGTPMSADKLLLSAASHPGLGINATDYGSVSYSNDEKYLIAYWFEGGHTSLKAWYALASSLDNPQWIPFVDKADDVTGGVVQGDSAFLQSRKNAPNYRILVRALKDPSKKERVVVPEGKENIQWITSAKDYLFYQTTNGVSTTIYQVSLLNGKSGRIELPFSGTAWISDLDPRTNDLLLMVNSWKQPGTVYDYDPKTGLVKESVFNSSAKYPGTDQLVVEEVEARSHDGILVPLSIIYNRKIERNGDNVTYLRGYGSYGATLLPYFNVLDLALLNRGVIIAFAHVRGGGEKGDAWYKGGFKATKPNTWKDFIACAEYLVQHKYTSPRRLIGEGTSAGGILIGRAMTERPDLFAVAVNDVPVSNPLRGENRPNGLMDAKEFGTAKDSIEANGLIEMDAYLHVLKGVKYPAVLAVTGFNDTRVPFWQPAKLVAKMQDLNPGNPPVMMLVSYESGHWSNEKLITFRNYAYRYAFALWQAGHKDFQTKQ